MNSRLIHNRLGKARLCQMVEEATVDAYGESEQTIGWLTMIENNVDFPFETDLLGLSVFVVGIDVNDRDELVALCRRGRQRQNVPLADLPLRSPTASSAEWIEAYQLWRRGLA